MAMPAPAIVYLLLRIAGGRCPRVAGCNRHCPIDTRNQQSANHQSTNHQSTNHQSTIRNPAIVNPQSPNPQSAISNPQSSILNR
jgi:hypothetical protein